VVAPCELPTVKGSAQPCGASIRPGRRGQRWGRALRSDQASTPRQHAGWFPPTALEHRSGEIDPKRCPSGWSTTLAIPCCLVAAAQSWGSLPAAAALGRPYIYAFTPQVVLRVQRAGCACPERNLQRIKTDHGDGAACQHRNDRP